MVRRSAPFLLGLLVCLLAVHPSGASSALRVDEAKIRLSLEGERTGVSLEVESDEPRTFAARVTVALLNPADKVLVEAGSDVEIRRGPNRLFVPLELHYARMLEAERRLFPLHRIRYRVEPRGGAAAPAEGFVSLSEAAPELFELRVMTSATARAGSSVLARVRATNPLTGRPVKGVAVSGELSFGGAGDPPAAKASATTGGDGFATLDFKVPREAVAREEADLNVEARLGALAEWARGTVTLDRRVRVILTTDKALYQPGQTVRARSLVFDPNDRALAGAKVTLKLKENSGETALSAEATTSRFGVASADWVIPESAKLGWYFLAVESEEGRYDFSVGGGRAVRVSRYDLPNFTVSVKPDRAYYLAGQQAAVEVRGDYLFGQPVKRARVRVVRETDRNWDYEKQKYVTEEREAVEGETDAQGRFTARLNLSEEWKELDEWESARYSDPAFAAYVTDPTTNRTEQRRFRLRITKEPVHVYVVEGRYNQAKGLPLAFYVSTSYADGSPCECEVAIVEEGATAVTRRAGEPSREVKESDRPLLKVRTNRYGLAKVIGPRVAEDETRSYIPLRFYARGGGRAGHHAEGLHVGRYYGGSRAPELRVETDKTVYREGEPVSVEVTSDAEDLRAFVDVTAGGRLLYSKSLSLSGGRASLVIPYAEGFRDTVTIRASGADPHGRDNDEYALGARAVVFPRDRELKLDVRMSRAEYKPGEEASAEFAVRTASGGGAESALGVVVFDKAVEERARTDEEFSNAWGFGDSLYGFWYESSSVGGVTQRDVERLEPSAPVPEGLDLVAELLYNDTGYYGGGNAFGGTAFTRDAGFVFQDLIMARLAPARDALKRRYEASGEHPKDAPRLSRLLSEEGVDFAALRDPWGRPYRANFYVERDEDVLGLTSDGPDERPDTDDDLTAALRWPYFKKVGEAVDRAAAAYHARTGGFVRDLATLGAELRREGFDLAALRDPWGQAYSFEFGVDGTSYTIRVRSGGPNTSFERRGTSVTDDFDLWLSLADYFAESREALEEALARDLREAGEFPDSEAALRAALGRQRLDFDALRDGWGRRLYANVSKDSRYTDLLSVDVGAREGAAETRRTHTPVTQAVRSLSLRSDGPDRVRGTYDDFTLAFFTSVMSEQSARDTTPRPASLVMSFAAGTGAIGGVVKDVNGAVVPGASVKAERRYSGDLSFSATTDGEGAFILRGLPMGLYNLSVESPGFKVVSISEVQVQSSNVTTVNVELQPGVASEVVTVAATSNFTLDAATSSVGVGRSVVERMSAPAQLSTPRLRDYFTETLLWQPSVETDREGRAAVRFKLADNTTTWRMSVIASTEDGRVGISDSEFVSTQPFFVEHDPPRVLTEGDRVQLPVVLRNYTARAQGVDVEMKPEAWFALEGAARLRAEVPASDAARPTFDFRAVASVKDGRQRVTARGPGAGDAVEKTVTVHPDGEERAATDTKIFGAAAALDVSVPADAVAGSARGELKVYPNLSAHLLEGVEAIMSRPYGCGEQTISSAYPSVLALGYYEKSRGDSDAAPPRFVDRARRYARQGYERLLEYRAPGGGFTYWGHGEPDVALTAYALRFLSDVSRVIDVDADEVIKETRGWLVRRQREDGSWPAHAWDGKEDPRRTALTTAFVARVLAATRGGDTGAAPAQPAQTQAQSQTQSQTQAQPQSQSQSQSQSQPQTASQPKAAETLPTLPRALRYLAARASEIDEPYLIASYALAAADAGDEEGARLAARKLAALARAEGDGVYWSLETNTPFYGWGLAGRVETTALAVRALDRFCRTRDARCGSGEDDRHAPSQPSPDPKSETRVPQPTSPKSEVNIAQLIERGLVFLLRSKDRYGVWYSTQATVNVHETLAALVADAGESGAGASEAEVFVNGRLAGSLALPPADKLTGPLHFDLTPFLAHGANRVELKRAGHPPRAQAQVVTSFYVPWSKVAAEARATAEARAATNAPAGDASGALRLSVAYDRASAAAINQEVTCSVAAERVGHRGYGMLLAEVGLPPGADVDRASLERTMKESGWAISRYDLLPDRLVVYLWPEGGGTRFTFKFRPRYGLDALTAPSRLYDYYNPEANVVVAPTRFVVR